jgi:2-phosphoglycerate kinase
MEKKLEKETKNPSPKMVETGHGLIPFSVGYLSNTLQGIGIADERAYKDAWKIFRKIRRDPKINFSSEDVMKLAADWYETKEPNLARRVEIIGKDLVPLRPLVILLGGVTGIGKSTLAQTVANRMGIHSLIGTDLIREILRVTLSHDLMPTLHTSSYVAHSQLNTSFLPSLSNVLVGFEEQVRTVLVGVESAIQQAILDDEIILIEGVHLVPGLLRKEVINDPRVVFLQLVLENEDKHHSRLARREKKAEGRGIQYLEHFEDIRAIQEYLVQHAEEENIPLIDVAKNEKATTKIINLIWETVLSKKFPVEEEEEEEEVIQTEKLAD